MGNKPTTLHNHAIREIQRKVWQAGEGQRRIHPYKRLGVINGVPELEESNYKVGKRTYPMLWKGRVPNPVGLEHKT